MGPLQGSRVQMAKMRPSLDLAPDQPGILERLDVLGRGCQRNVERLRELPHGPCTAAQVVQHPAAGRIAQGMEDRIHIECLKFNHAVNNSDVRSIVNQPVK